MDEVYQKFNKARIFCICVSYGTSIAVLLISLQIAGRPRKKLITMLTPAKHASILYSFSLVWLIDIVWIMYLDHMALMGHSALNTPQDIYSQKFIYFIVIADFILIALVLTITPFLCKQTFFQRFCKLGNNYITASKEYLVISSFMMFAVIHANHLVFIIFGFLIEPIHALAKLIEFITTVAYFISIFNIIFHYHRKYKEGGKSRFLHYSKLGLKLIYFYLYFVILFFTFSYLFYRDAMTTEHQCLIKSISISTLVWLMIIAIHFSHRWSGTMNYISTTTATATTTATTTTTTTTTNNNNNRINVTKSTGRSNQMDKSRAAGYYELKKSEGSTADSIQQKIDEEPLIDK